MDKHEARKMVEDRLNGCTITEIEDLGDAFAVYYVNDEYHHSGNFAELEVGAGPFICIKETREAFSTGSGQSAEDYLKAYRECGDIYGQLSETIEIAPDKLQDDKRAMLGLKSILGLELAESKKLFEKMKSKGRLKFTLNSEWDAQQAKNKLEDKGFSVKRTWKTSGNKNGGG